MSAARTLALSRDLYVPRELIFEVWTQPEHLREWHCPGPDDERRAEVDARPGGEYALRWQNVDGTTHTQHGEYELMQAPARLIYSARLRDRGKDLRSTRVEVAFTDLGGGTRVDLRETGYRSDAAREAGEQDWRRRLDQLEAYFSAI